MTNADCPRVSAQVPLLIRQGVACEKLLAAKIVGACALRTVENEAMDVRNDRVPQWQCWSMQCSASNVDTGGKTRKN